MDRITASLKFATKATEALKSVNIEEDNIISIGFDKYTTHVHLRDCPEAYSFINLMQAKVKLRMQNQRAFGEDSCHTLFNYLTQTQLPFELTITSKKK